MLKLIGATLLVVLAGSALAQEEDEQFKIVVQTNSHADTLAHGNAGTPKDDPAVATSSTQGNEQSQCNAGEERRSSSEARAEVRHDTVDTNQVTATLVAHARTNGGHFARCGTCVLGTCVGRMGEDTSAVANARAALTARVAFDPDARGIRYDMVVREDREGDTAGLAVEVRDAGDQLLHPVDVRGTRTYVIEGGPNRVFTVVARFAQKSENSGGCCNDSHSGSARLFVTIDRSPIIASQRETDKVVSPSGKLVPFIVGGMPENGFPVVGALLYKNAMHCTGTLIGPRTVLTAAHCVYRRKAKDFVWVQGQNVLKPASTSTVSAFEYPRDAAAGFRYVDKTLTDDIAVVYLDSAPNAQAMTVYGGVPPLDSVVDQKLPLTFVGYGYARVGGELVAGGLKRSAQMPMAKANTRTFRYETPQKNTCYGDSGGPAFLVAEPNLFVVGVTSGGDQNCTQYGIDTRVDAYQPWLAPRIK